MTVERTDLFHCQVCGRIAYHSHGAIPPACCGQSMVRAVADVAKDLSHNQLAAAVQELELEQHALLAEASEIANWCHSLEDIDVARHEQLAQRLQSLYDALSDQFDLEIQEGELAKALAAGTRFHEAVSQLRDEHRQLLLAMGRFVAELRQEEVGFRDWAEVCEQLDSLAADLRRHEEAESDLVQLAIQEGSSPRG